MRYAKYSGVNVVKNIWPDGGNCNHTRHEMGGTIDECLYLCLESDKSKPCNAILFGTATEESNKNVCKLLKCKLVNGKVPPPTQKGSHLLGFWIDPGSVLLRLSTVFGHSE